MTFINFIPDDLGVQRLKSDNAQPGSARAVTAVEPYPAQQPGQPHPAPMVLRRQRDDKRKQERRAEDRRKQQEPVLLDTRIPNHRRRAADRRENAEQDAVPLKELNLFA